MKWISVKEQLPEVNEKVLIFEAHTKEMYVGERLIFSPTRFRIELPEYYETYSIDIDKDPIKHPGTGTIFHVTHWMPLPDVPNEIL